MTLRSRFNFGARKLFKKIYKNEKISIEGLKTTLKDQLAFYLDHLGEHVAKKISEKDQARVFEIIERNNRVADVLSSADFLKTIEKKKTFLGPVSLGLVFCIDGRIPAIFLGGRFASHWEVPAGEIKVTRRKSDNKLIPESSELCESLRKLVTTEKDLLEIVFGHTSLLDPSHGCGAMAAKRKMGEISADVSLEDENLKIIKEKTIPAITTLYNEFRSQKGFGSLKRVCLPATYDTDTFGVILNYNLRKTNETLSTTELTNKYKDQLDKILIKNNIVFGSFSERFTHLTYLCAFSENVLKVIEILKENKDFEELRQTIKNYSEKHFNDLTDNQKKALEFFLLRSIAFQYLSGSSSPTKKNLSHAFAHHLEGYMAVSTRGTVIGKFDPEDQGFASTPADAQSCIKNIQTMLLLLSNNKHSKKPYILFICNPVNIRDLRENSIQLHKIMDANAEILRSIVSEKSLGEMIENTEIIPVPVLIEENTRAVLKIIDHSAYI